MFITMENGLFRFEDLNQKWWEAKPTAEDLADQLIAAGWRGEHFTTSSNLDFPEIAGLPEHFRAHEILQSAMTLAQDRIMKQTLQKLLRQPSRGLTSQEAAWHDRFAALLTEMPPTLKVVVLQERVFLADRATLQPHGTISLRSLLAEVEAAKSKMVPIEEL